MTTKEITTMTPWQRLEQVINWTGLSTNKFAQSIGIKRSENLYQIKRGSFGISKELSGLVSTRYPEVNRAWLLTGDGEMLVGVCAAGIHPETVIPYYDYDVAQFWDLDFRNATPLNNISLPFVADFALQFSGNSMTPNIPIGSTVVFRKVDVGSILPGQSYMVVTREFSTLRIVRTHPSDETKVILQAKNTSEYDDISVEKTKIKKIYALKAVITIIN